ncbi:hypothetical protein U8V72_20085 [Priestia filamentosa]|uniref:hypothetical protein n=1 Tax=Priestia filamentosa TaxID=1402861 RepID=UPI00397E3E2B
MKNKISIISIILAGVSLIIGIRGTVFLKLPSQAEMYLYKETWVDSVNFYMFLFFYLALPVISLMLSFFSKKSPLKYIAISVSLAVVLWNVVIPFIMVFIVFGF